MPSKGVTAVGMALAGCAVALSAAVADVYAGPTLLSGNARLEVVSLEAGGFGLRLAVEQDPREGTCFEQLRPLSLEVVSDDGSAHWIEGAYDTVEADDTKVTLTGTLASPNGTLFAFTDTFAPHAEAGAFAFERRVAPHSAAAGDAGFSSRFGLWSLGPAEFEAYDVFVPGVWYRQNQSVPKSAIGGDYSDTAFYFREARATAPVCMVMDRASGTVVSLTRLGSPPETFHGEDFLARIIDERMQFGSFGFEKGREGEGPRVAFLFPGTEGEKTYVEGSSASRRWALRSHPVRPDIAHTYALLIRLERHLDFDSAMKRTWRRTYDLCAPRLVRADIAQTYRDGVDLLARLSDHDLDTPGLPFSADLQGKPLGFNYLMGFVGHQVLCGYHLLHWGLTQGRPEFRARGEAIVDFWATRSYEGAASADALPHTWWQPEEPPGLEPGQAIWGQYERERFWRDEPRQGEVFMRTLSDGHLAMLRAWMLMRDHQIDRADWRAWAERFGRWLVTHQNEDGSWYRKYHVTGRPLETAKLNTTHPIPFLALLHRVTGEDAYRAAALRAGEFSWRAIHLPGLYVGGTTDNPNTIDKEAAYLALDAFLALYDLDSDDARWMEAAERAATYGETWTYVRDIPMPPGDAEAAPYDAIDTAGLSLVATGHTYADCFNAFYPHAYYRLYRLTGDRHYFDYANLILHNTKQMLDTDGSKGFGHPGLQTEGIGMDVLRGRGPRVWLPWVSAAQIDAPHRLLRDYGSMVLEECERSREPGQQGN